MEELKTTCRQCRAEILATTAERNDGLCAHCYRQAHPVHVEPRSDDEQKAIAEIHKKVLAGCSAEEFTSLKCPVCGSKLRISTHPGCGASALVFVACNVNTTHVAFTEASKFAPPWWEAHRSEGWIIE
jgi:hypothetical protein